MLPYIYLLLSALADSAPAPVFREQTIDSTISIGYGLAIGDVDGDGKQDILLADARQIVWYRNGDWKKFVMAENLTEFDNVCIAARDLDGDGKVEVAVGAQWNPSETSDSTKSGSVHYLIRPADATAKWKQVTLRHEPTVHRMRWVKTGGRYYLVVLPLHGRNNKGGEGAGVKVYAYEFPGSEVSKEWNRILLSEEMHLTHNMAVSEERGQAEIYVAGREGVRRLTSGKSGSLKADVLSDLIHPAGEIRLARQFITTIEPMHGHTIAVYPKEGGRLVIDTTLREGHALAAADILQTGADQVIAGWRNPDSQGQTGIRLYTKTTGGKWQRHWVDKNGMACEDLQVADLDGDGKMDIVASGRSTKNVKIYWNRN